MTASAYAACGMILAGCAAYAAHDRISAAVTRAASAWNRGKAVHDRIELTAAEKQAWRRLRRRFAREARHAALAAADSERRPA